MRNFLINKIIKSIKQFVKWVFKKIIFIKKGILSMGNKISWFFEKYYIYRYLKNKIIILFLRKKKNTITKGVLNTEIVLYKQGNNFELERNIFFHGFLYVFNNGIYVLLWVIFCIVFVYTFQSEIVLLFFPDLVISNFEMYFEFESPWNLQNQIFFVIDDKITNAKFVKDYGYFFNKYDCSGSILNNYNLFYVTYNTYMRKAQFVGFDTYNKSNDTVKYKYDEMRQMYNDDVFDSMNPNVLMEHEITPTTVSYKNFRIYLNQFYQQVDRRTDKYSKAFWWRPFFDLDEYYYFVSRRRSENFNPLFRSRLNDGFIYSQSMENMYKYLTISTGSYMGSAYKNFFVWLYNKYNNSIYFNLFDLSLYKKYFKYPQLLNFEYIDLQLFRRKRYLPHVYPNKNYRIDKLRKRNISGFLKNLFLNFYIDFYSYVIKGSFINIFNYAELKGLENTFKAFYYKLILENQAYLGDKNKKSFYENYKNSLYLSVLKDYILEDNGYQEGLDSDEIIPLSIFNESQDEDLEVDNFNKNMGYLKSDFSNDLFNYYHLPQKYLDEVFIKLYPRYNFMSMDLNVPLSYFYNFNINYINNLNSIDFKMINHLNDVENILMDKLDDDINLMRRFNFVNEFLKLNSFFSLYKKLKIYDLYFYEYLFDGMKDRKIFDDFLFNLYSKINKYYFYYNLERMYDFSDLRETLNNKWSYYGNSPIDLYLKRNNYKYKLLKTEEIRDKSRSYLLDEIKLRYLWNFELKNLIYFYFMESYIRPFLFEGYKKGGLYNDLYGNLFLNYMGHSVRNLHRILFNSFEFELFNFSNLTKEMHNDVVVLYQLFLFKKIIDNQLKTISKDKYYFLNSNYYMFDFNEWPQDLHLNYINYFKNIRNFYLLKKDVVDLDSDHVDYFTVQKGLEAKHKHNFSSFKVIDYYLSLPNLRRIIFNVPYYFDWDRYKEYKLNQIYHPFILFKKFYYNLLNEKYNPLSYKYLNESEIMNFLMLFRLKYYSSFLWDRYSDNVFFENDLRFSKEVYDLFGIGDKKGYLNKLRGISYWDNYIYNNNKIDGYIFNINKKFAKNISLLNGKVGRRRPFFFSSLETENLKTIQNLNTSTYIRYGRLRDWYYRLDKKITFYLPSFNLENIDSSFIKNKDFYYFFYNRENQIFDLLNKRKAVVPKVYRKLGVNWDKKLLQQFKKKVSGESNYASLVETFKENQKRRIRYSKRKKKFVKNYNISLSSLIERGFFVNSYFTHYKKTKRLRNHSRAFTSRWFSNRWRFNKDLYRKSYKKRLNGTSSKYDNDWNLYHSYYFDELRLYEPPVEKNLLSMYYQVKNPLKDEGLTTPLTGENDINGFKYKNLHDFYIMSEKPYALQTRATKMLPLFIRYIYRNKDYKYVVIDRRKDVFLKNFFSFEKDDFSLLFFIRKLMYLFEFKNNWKLFTLIDEKNKSGINFLYFFYIKMFSFFVFILNIFFKFFYYVFYMIDVIYSFIFNSQTRLFPLLVVYYNYLFKDLYYMGLSSAIGSRSSAENFFLPYVNFFKWSGYKQYRFFNRYPFENTRLYFQKIKYFLSFFLAVALIMLLGEKMFKYISIYFSGGDDFNSDEYIDLFIVFGAFAYISYYTVFLSAWPAYNIAYRAQGHVFWY